MIIDIPCVILAGGKSSRMGEDKALLPFGGFKTLTEYQLHKFSKDFQNIYISCKDKNKFHFQSNFIEDHRDYEDSAPFIAILSILKTLDHEKVFIISVDVPFFDLKHFKKLYNKQIDDNHQAIVAKNDRVQPLCAIYDKNIIPILEKLIKEKKYKFSYLFDKISIKFVEFNDKKTFTNLNTPSEYEKTLIRMKHG